MSNPDKPVITNYKHLKLGKLIPNLNTKISNKIKNQLFGSLNFGDCDLFVICVLLFELFYY